METILEATSDTGIIGSNYSGIAVSGFSDMLGIDGNFEDSVVTARNGTKNYRVTYTTTKIGEFEERYLRRSDGTKWMLPAMTTKNLTFTYSFDLKDNPARLRFSIRNLEDERAPLQIKPMAIGPGVTGNYGRNYYLELE